MSRILVTLVMAALVAGCATSSEEEPPPEPTPAAAPAPPPPAAPAPEPEPTPVAEPMLPDTAGALPLVGLVGAGALALAGAVRGLRRFLV